jgi:outer membrane lipoprotein-sorting protein
MKKHSLCTLALLIASFLFMNIRAQENYVPVKDPSQLRQKVIETSQQTNSISSDFVQIKRLSFLEEDVQSEGKFYFQKENQLRWEYSKPFFYLIIFNHDTILIRDENKTNSYDAASNRMFREINNIMLSMVNGTILESKNFNFEYFEDPSTFMLELSPLEQGMKEFLSKIRLLVNKNDYSVDELYMIERSGDYTHIRFINKSLNEEIPEHIFDLH